MRLYPCSLFCLACASTDVAPEDCWAAARALGLEDSNWLLEFDRYHEFFNNESVYLLPYTGAYVGADAIAEYVAFGAPGSVFFESQVTLDDRIDLPSISGSTCSFVLLTHILIRSHAPARPAEVEFASLLELNLNLDTNKVSSFNYYWDSAFEGLLNTFVFATPASISFVCSRVHACGYHEPECEARMSGLPVVEGDLNWADGNSQGCRYLHSTFTEENPDGHCAHIALEPTPDPKGAIKCYQSERIRPEDVFSQSQLELHAAYSQERGLPPGGFAFRCSQTSACPPGYTCAHRDRRRILFASLPDYNWCVQD